MAGAVDTVARVETLTEAVEAAAAIARAGDAVPALTGGTSFDAYPRFEARGEAFAAARGRARWFRGGVAIAVTSNRRGPARGPDFTLLALVAVLTITAW